MSNVYTKRNVITRATGSNTGVEKKSRLIDASPLARVITCLSSRVNYYRLTRMENERAKGKEELKDGGKRGEGEESSRFSSEKERKKKRRNV